MPSDSQPIRPGAGAVTTDAQGEAGARITAPRARDAFTFLAGFLRHPARVGALVPSSACLEQRLVRQAGVAQAHTVVELGPGTGGTTAALLQAMPAHARLLALELDPRFHRHLSTRLRDPRLLLELGSAQRLAQCLADHRLPPPQAIVTGIPFSTLPASQARRTAALLAQVLAPGGRLVAYQVRGHVARYLAPHLGPPQQAWEWCNLPPVRVMTWVRP